MAIIHDNPLLKGASGSVGNVTYKKWRGRIVMANKPGKRTKTSAKQKDQQTTFRSAVRFAKRACAVPEIKAMYAKGINDRKHSANAVALSDYLNPPEIREIDVLSYTGAPGELIRVRAFDDFKVKSVSITISNADGSVIETGEAQPRGKRGLWRMTTAVRNNHRPGTVFTVAAKDMSGNVTRKTVAIPVGGFEVPPVETSTVKSDNAIQQGATDGSQGKIDAAHASATDASGTSKTEAPGTDEREPSHAMAKNVIQTTANDNLQVKHEGDDVPLWPLSPLNIYTANKYHKSGDQPHHHGSRAPHQDSGTFRSDSSPVDSGGDGGG